MRRESVVALRRSTVSVLWRGAVFTLLWGALTQGDPAYFIYAVASVVLATGMSLWLMPPNQGGGLSKSARGGEISRPTQAWGFLVLVAWFGWQCARGGVDVAIRALRRTPDIDPATVTAPVLLPPGNARQLSMVLINLMPGSLIQRDIPGRCRVCGQQGSTTAVELHTLAASLDPARQFSALQRKIGRAWGWECGQESGREELALKPVICGDPRCEGSSTLD